MSHDPKLDTNQAADYLGYSVSTLEWWRNVGRGPRYLKPARKVSYLASDLDAWMNGGAVEPVEGI